jgi:ParB family chromosome partitioning protein
MTTPALKKRGLGRGLGNLLSDTALDIRSFTSPDKEKTTHLAVEKLQPGKYQPRQTLSQAALQELAESIQAQGVLQPVIVRKTASLQYEIIAGERRWRASQLAGLTEIPVIIRDVPDNAAIAMALIENIQREDLNALEEARALKRLQDEFHLTQQQVAEAVGKSRVSVTHLLRLLELHPFVQASLGAEEIDKGHAKVLMGLSLADQARAAAIIVQKGLSVRETEKLIQQWSSSSNPVSHASILVKKAIDPDIQALEKKLSDYLGTSVTIHHNKKNRGKLVIHYRNLDILDGVLSKLETQL